MATRSKYIQIKAKDIPQKSAENEIRLSRKTRENRYIVYAAALLLDKDKKITSVTLKGLGETIPRVLLVAEILRRRIKGLHQINKISNTTIEEIYEPTENGLDTVIVKRTLSMLEIKLTTEPTA